MPLGTQQHVWRTATDKTMTTSGCQCSTRGALGDLFQLGYNRQWIIPLDKGLNHLPYKEHGNGQSKVAVVVKNGNAWQIVVLSSS